MLIARRAHRAHSCENRPARYFRRPSGDFQVLRAAGVALDPERHRLVLRLQVILPEVGCFQNMPVSVDRARVTKFLNPIKFCRHLIESPAPGRHYLANCRNLWARAYSSSALLMPTAVLVPSDFSHHTSTSARVRAPSRRCSRMRPRAALVSLAHSTLTRRKSKRPPDRKPIPNRRVMIAPAKHTDSI